MQVGVLMIGLGAIGQEVVRQLDGDDHARINQILVRPGREEYVREHTHNDIKIVSSLKAVDPLPKFVLECASHEAVEEFGPYFLKKGVDFGVISVGAFSKPKLFESLQRAGEIGGAQLSVLSGAIGGIDALSAARVEGLEKVLYVARKPPQSWVGTRAANTITLDALKTEQVIYEGNAREAAELFPKNANVAATVALAGLGFDDTVVRLVADPNVTGNVHVIEASGTFGQFCFEIVGAPLTGNPRSSTLTAFSAVRAIKNRFDHIRV